MYVDCCTVSDVSVKYCFILIRVPCIFVIFIITKKCTINIITGCPRRNVPDFLMLKYTDITQNTYVQISTVTEIMAREKCGLLARPRTVPLSWQSYPCPSMSVVSYYGKLHMYFLQSDNVVHVTSLLGIHVSCIVLGTLRTTMTWGECFIVQFNGFMSLTS
jgi:hypothetical protein